MKIWIVMQDSHEDKWPVAVYSSKEKADEYVAHHKSLWIPDDEGFELDGPPRFVGT